VNRLLLMGKPEGKGTLDRPRHTWKDSKQMDLKLRQ
jgi:hypothetical protein